MKPNQNPRGGQSFHQRPALFHNQVLDVVRQRTDPDLVMAVEGIYDFIFRGIAQFNQYLADPRRFADLTDLFAFAKAKLNEIQQPANVHFTPAGSKELGEKVAQAILAQLE